MIKGFVYGQGLSIQSPVIVADTINYLTAEFIFRTPDWNGLTKIAHFSNKKRAADIELVNDRILASAGLNLSEGVWSVSLTGHAYENGVLSQRITTTVSTFRVKPSALHEGEPIESLPSYGEKILGKIEEIDNEVNAMELTVTDLGNSVSDLKTAQASVTPETFGAKGDGETDDTIAIQAAVDSGYPVRFEKSYAVNKAIAIKGSCVLMGDKDHFIKQTASNTNLFEIEEAENVVIDSLHLIGVGTDYQPHAGGKQVCFGLKIKGTADAPIKTTYVANCLIENFSHADISIAYSGNAVITSNTIIGTGVDGSMSDGDNYQFGIEVSDCDSVRISRNDVSYVAQGIYLGKDVNDLIIDSNVIHDITGQHGIYSTYANCYSIVNNIFRNIVYAGAKIQHDDYTSADSKNILVSGNIFDSVGQQGFMLTTVESTPIYYYVGAKISNNIFRNCHTGILVQRSKETVISDNIYIGGTYKVAGISIGRETEKMLIQNNKITNSENGIYARNTAVIDDITLKGNVLKDAGISFAGAVSITGVTYIDNIADSVAGLPDRIVIGKKQNSNIYFAPSTMLDAVNYKAGDIVLFNNASSVDYMGAVMNPSKAWVYFGSYLDYVEYIFSIIPKANWTINSFTAYSKGEHTLTISWSITCNVRATAVVIGDFTGIPAALLPSDRMHLATFDADGYDLYINSAGTLAVGFGVAGTTYTKTVTLVDGQIVN